MGLPDIIGHSAAVELLQRTIAGGRVPHAILIHGPDGVGKRTLALAFASALLCEDRVSGGCGSCSSCSRIASLNHPDLVYVTRPLKKDKDKEANRLKQLEELAKGRQLDNTFLKTVIGVDQIRDMSLHAGFPPKEGRFRVFLIDPGDRLQPAAQNALLKTLEEPPSRTVILLTADRPHVLLPTVRSRCLSIGLGPSPATDLAAVLVDRGIERGEALARAALSGGRPGRALALDVEALRGRRGAILDDLVALAEDPTAIANLADIVKSLTGPAGADLEEGIELCQGLVRDAARIAGGATPDRLLHADLATELARLGGALGANRAGALLVTFDRLRARLSFPANRTLLAETLLAAVAGGPTLSGRPDS